MTLEEKFSDINKLNCVGLEMGTMFVILGFI